MSEASITVSVGVNWSVALHVRTPTFDFVKYPARNRLGHNGVLTDEKRNQSMSDK